MRQIHQVHHFALSRYGYIHDTLIMPSATDCEIASLLTSARLPLLSPGLRFRSCEDIRVRAVGKCDP